MSRINSYFRNFDEHQDKYLDASRKKGSKLAINAFISIFGGISSVEESSVLTCVTGEKTHAKGLALRRGQVNDIQSRGYRTSARSALEEKVRFGDLKVYLSCLFIHLRLTMAKSLHDMKVFAKELDAQTYFATPIFLMEARAQ